MVVTATGMQTQMGQIATMLTSVTRTRSPLQQRARLADQGARASSPGARSRSSSSSGWSAAWPFSELLLLGTAMAISAIPTGLPAFVSGLLSMGAKQLAEAKAVVKNLTDVETLGATSAINTDKTGTLTMNQMMVSTIYASGVVVHRRGRGLPQDRRDHVGRRRPGAGLHPAGARAGRSTATRPSPTTARWSATRPRRRSSCSRRSSASTPRRPAAPTRAWPRCRSTPSTSSWPPSTASPVDGRRAGRRAGQGRRPTSCSRAAARRAAR